MTLPHCGKRGLETILPIENADHGVRASVFEIISDEDVFSGRPGQQNIASPKIGRTEVWGGRFVFCKRS